MRFIAIVMLALSCMSGGYYMAWMEKKKLYFLGGLKKMFVLLQGELQYGNIPVGEACMRVAEKVKPPYADFLKEVGKGAEQREAQKFVSIWEEACRDHMPEPYFTTEGWKEFLAFGQVLGYLDLSLQFHGFELLLEGLERNQKECRVSVEKNGKVYKTIGIGMGMMIAIVFI